MRIVKVEDLDLALTLTSGQTFYWGHFEGEDFVFGEPDEEGFWWGVLRGKVWKIKQEGDKLIVEKGDADDAEDIFGSADDIRLLMKRAEEIEDWPLIEALQRYRGLRMMKQDPWEMLVSFMLSPQNRVESIAKGTYILAKELGGGLYPSPKSLSEAPDDLLRSLPIRYEAQAFRLREVAKILSKDPEFWNRMPYDYKERRKYLTRLPGVGRKIADCVLAYGLGDGRAVPIDTHMLKISSKYYGFSVKGKSLTERVYDSIGDFYRSRYGELSALAQLYLYALSRKPNVRRSKRRL